METKTAHWEHHILWSNDGVCLAHVKRETMGWYVECADTSPLVNDDWEYHHEFHEAKTLAIALAKAAGYRMISSKLGIALLLKQSRKDR